MDLERAAQALRRAEADMPAARARAQDRARAIVAAAQGKVDKARDQRDAAIVAEYQAGARVGELARRADLTRETIRRILRAAGIEAD